MKLCSGFLAAIVIVAMSNSASFAADKEDGTALFNGKDMKGFKFFLAEKSTAKPEEIWSVKESAIICSGKVSGYFYTEKSFKNYVLTYEWRYPEGSKPESNSGCLVHITEPHKIWPKSVEPQGRYMDHGKLFFIGNKPTENKFDAEALKKALKPIGQWGKTEITCKDGAVSVKVNGADVSSGKGELTEGPIGWQSEGFEIHFRNIRIKEMK